MKNRKKMQKAMDEIVRLKVIIQSNNGKLDHAYLEYYRTLGLTDDQAAKLIRGK